MTLAVVATFTTLLAVVVGMKASSASTSPCTVDCAVTKEWPSGFKGAITVTNNGSAVDAWVLSFDFGDGQAITKGWGGDFS